MATAERIPLLVFGLVFREWSLTLKSSLFTSRSGISAQLASPVEVEVNSLVEETSSPNAAVTAGLFHLNLCITRFLASVTASVMRLMASSAEQR